MVKRSFVVGTTVTTQQVHDQLISAFEGGINYWARWDRGASVAPAMNASAIDDKNVYPYADWPLMGGSVVVLDMEDKRKAHKLDAAAIQRGLDVMASKFPRHFADVVGDGGDATTGDVFVQCCLFGDVLYG